MDELFFRMKSSLTLCSNFDKFVKFLRFLNEQGLINAGKSAGNRPF